MDLKERLLSKIEKKENGCWEWTGALRVGYGVIKFEKKSLSTHRASYEIFIGPIEDGLFVCHKCDNRKCINPEHLWLGTQKDNMQDCLSKGRYADNIEALEKYQFKKGEKAPNRIIDSDKAREIKQYIKDNYPDKKLTEIAEIFDVPCQMIRDMRRGRSYLND